MNIQLSDHFSYKKLIWFALPPIGSMVFTSLYGIVDGYFVSNYAGATPFASLNLAMFTLAELSAGLLASLFVGYDAELYALTLKGLRMYSVAFLIMGLNIFGSAFFTALNNGMISAILSVSRTLVLEVIMIYLLPILFGGDGLWAVVIAVEGIGIILTMAFLIRNGERYGYREKKKL